MNALKAMLPELDPQSSSIPCGATDLKNDYILLPKHDYYPTKVATDKQCVIEAYLSHLALPVPKLRCWAWLCLPNGQVACSQFMELGKAPENVRMAQNIKVLFDMVLVHTFLSDMIGEDYT